MLTRREAIRLLGSLSIAPAAFESVVGGGKTPPLAPGAPHSPERLALIEAFEKQSDGLDRMFVARTHDGAWKMPYRLFRPAASDSAPLVVYLHGSGGLGDDNAKQLGLGNVFGTRVWALPGNQKTFPCFVLAPQTDRGWVRYDAAPTADGIAKPVPGLGEGARAALEIIDRLVAELPIDRKSVV